MTDPTVYIGKDRYHDSAMCASSGFGQSLPDRASLSEAVERGKSPCGNCFPPYPHEAERFTHPDASEHRIDRTLH